MKKWKTILALFFLILAILLDWNWFWALFILIGLLHVFRTKEIHFVESITKKDNPKLYWFMIVLWTLMAIYQMWNYLK